MIDTVRALCGFEARGACTDAERRAAEWLRAELARRGHEAWVEPVWTRPGWAGSLLLHAAVAVLASVLSVSLPAAGLALALVAGAGLALERSGRGSPLRLGFRRRATQVVVTEPEDPEAIRLVLCAGYDAPLRGLVLRDGWRRAGARIGARLPGPLGSLGAFGWLALACLVIAAAAGARLAGIDAGWLGAVQFPPTVALLLAFAAASDIALSEVSPGASEPASGTAVALALLDELSARPPAELSPCVLLAGASSALPPTALRAFLRSERLVPADTVLLELGACGAGEPAVAAGHPQLRAAAAEAGLPALRLPRPSALRAARSRRLPAAHLACRDTAGIAPRARTAGDTPDAVDPDALEAAYDAALDLVDALDETLAARHPAAAARELASSAK